MEDQLIDSSPNDSPKDVILEIIRWWEKKRLLFNLIIIGIVALITIPFLISYPHRYSRVVSAPFIFQSLFFFFFINCAYCAGWVIQLLAYYYFKVKSDSNTLNYILFTLGTLFTGLVTLAGYSSYL